MRRALVVWGGIATHEPEAGAALVAEMLRKDGFDVVVSGDCRIIGEPFVHELSLVVPVITGPVPVESEDINNLEVAVRNGVGLAGYHGGLAASFRGQVKFHFMAGSQWVAHPGGVISYRVNITRPTDPVMEGLSDFDYVSEQYYLHVDPAVEVLATTTFSGEHAPWRTNVVMPVVYKTQYGAARVFYTALGHKPAEFDRMEPREILRRGMLWAAQER